MLVRCDVLGTFPGRETVRLDGNSLEEGIADGLIGLLGQALALALGRSIRRSGFLPGSLALRRSRAGINYAVRSVVMRARRTRSDTGMIGAMPSAGKVGSAGAASSEFSGGAEFSPVSSFGCSGLDGLGRGQVGRMPGPLRCL